MLLSTRRLFFVLVTLSGLAAAAVESEEVTPPNDLASAEAAAATAETSRWTLADYEGAWVRVERESDDASREEAVLAATETISLILRGPTRVYMRRTMVPAERYVIAVDGRRLSIDRQPGEKTAFDLDAPVEGATVVFEDGVLRRDWRHGESTLGTTTWTLSGDGSRMAVRRLIRNARLGSPADYTTAYARERQRPAGLSRGRP